MHITLSHILQGGDIAIAAVGAGILLWKARQGEFSLRNAPSLSFAPRLEHLMLLLWLFLTTVVVASNLSPLLQPWVTGEAAAAPAADSGYAEDDNPGSGSTDQPAQVVQESPLAALFEALMTNVVQSIVLVLGGAILYSTRRPGVDPSILSNSTPMSPPAQEPHVRAHRGLAVSAWAAAWAVLAPTLVGLAICGILLFLTRQGIWFFDPHYKPGSHMVLRLLGSAGAVWWGLPILWIGAVIIAPISEEICFRGLLQGCLSRLLSRRMAVVSAGLLFGLAHYGAHKEAVPPLIGLGVYLGFLYEKSGRLSLPITVHALFNLKNMMWATLGFMGP